MERFYIFCLIIKNITEAINATSAASTTIIHIFSRIVSSFFSVLTTGSLFISSFFSFLGFLENKEAFFFGLLSTSILNFDFSSFIALLSIFLKTSSTLVSLVSSAFNCSIVLASSKALY